MYGEVIIDHCGHCQWLAWDPTNDPRWVQISITCFGVTISLLLNAVLMTASRSLPGQGADNSYNSIRVFPE